MPTATSNSTKVPGCSASQLPKPRASGWTKVVLGSTALWLVVWIAAVDAAVKAQRPLRFVSMGAYIASDQNPLFPKFDALLHTNQKIDVLLLGSSLVMAAAYNADEKSGAAVPRQLGYDRASYTGAAYFRKVFKDELSRDLNIFNFAGPSCMISDSYMVLSSAIRTGHAPRAVCIGVAPRDFIDNMVGPMNKSVYFSFFEKQGLGLDAKNETSFQENIDRWLERTFHFYRVRADYKALCELGGGDIFHRSTSLYDAVHKANGADKSERAVSFINPTAAEYEDKTVSAEIMKKSLLSYTSQYLPINQARYQGELDYFEKLHHLCQKSGIELLVVNMPLTQDNQRLLPDNFKQDYQQKVAGYCKASGIAYVDLNGGAAFDNNDFNDSAHVNGAGGIKIWQRLAKALATGTTGFFGFGDTKQLAGEESSSH